MPVQNPASLPRKLACEFVGTAFLLAAVIGSGIMGENLSGGNDAVALLANTLSTGCALIVLILIFGPVSGAHFNPVVSLAFGFTKQLPLKDLLFYIPVQIAGGICGALLAHVMYGLPLIELSSHVRTGYGIWISEVVASFGLITTIYGCLRFKPDAVPYAVGLFIMSAYWFTASTSFANPAAAIARSLTDTFAGIRLIDSSGFIFAQITGMLLSLLFVKWIYKND